MQTIVALSTGAIHGAIAIVRLSGPNALPIAARLFRTSTGRPIPDILPRVACLGEVYDGDTPIDQAVATRYIAPNSYTGEDVVELACHGSRYVIERILQLAVEQGARLAERGEFTRRAFLNGKLDLAQAEAVADLISAETAAQAKIAFSQLRGDLSKDVDLLRSKLLELAALLELELDFSEEDIEFANRDKLQRLVDNTLRKTNKLLGSFATGNAIKEGVKVVIAGAPNAGKSSLLNAMAKEEVALVSDIPGTTRDAIETTLRIDGITFRLIDTAGLRTAQDPVERMGIDRAGQRIGEAAALLVVIDSTSPRANATQALEKSLEFANPNADLAVLLSKADLSTKESLIAMRSQIQTAYPKAIIIDWAAPSRQGEEQILEWLHSLTARLALTTEDTIVTSARHIASLSAAQKNLNELLQAITSGVTTDILAYHLRAAINSLASITGCVSNDAILDYIFSRFCIGK